MRKTMWVASLLWLFCGAVFASTASAQGPHPIHEGRFQVGFVSFSDEGEKFASGATAGVSYSLHFESGFGVGVSASGGLGGYAMVLGDLGLRYRSPEYGSDWVAIRFRGAANLTAVHAEELDFCLNLYGGGCAGTPTEKLTLFGGSLEASFEIRLRRFNIGVGAAVRLLPGGETDRDWVLGVQPQIRLGWDLGS